MVVTYRIGENAVYEYNSFDQRHFSLLDGFVSYDISKNDFCPIYLMLWDERQWKMYLQR